MAEVISSHRPLLMGLLATNQALVADLTWVDQTNSTNADLLTDLTAQAAGPWSVRIASGQHSGRGRQGRSWESPNGSIPLSIAVPLADFAPSPTWLSLLTAVALKTSLQKYCADVIKIKWPNDGFISTGKFAGILIELNKDYAVIGVGINFFAAPDLDTATDLKITDYLPALADFLLTLFELISNSAKLSNAQLRDLITPEIDTINQEVEVQLQTGEKITGTAIELTDQGGLVINAAGNRVEVVSGEVEHLRPAYAR